MSSIFLICLDFIPSLLLGLVSFIISSSSMDRFNSPLPHSVISLIIVLSFFEQLGVLTLILIFLPRVSHHSLIIYLLEGSSVIPALSFFLSTHHHLLNPLYRFVNIMITLLTVIQITALFTLIGLESLSPWWIKLIGDLSVLLSSCSPALIINFFDSSSSCNFSNHTHRLHYKVSSLHNLSRCGFTLILIPLITVIANQTSVPVPFISKALIVSSRIAWMFTLVLFSSFIFFIVSRVAGRLGLIHLAITVPIILCTPLSCLIAPLILCGSPSLCDDAFSWMIFLVGLLFISPSFVIGGFAFKHVRRSETHFRDVSHFVCSPFLIINCTHTLFPPFETNTTDLAVQFIQFSSSWIVNTSQQTTNTSFVIHQSS